MYVHAYVAMCKLIYVCPCTNVHMCMHICICIVCMYMSIHIIQCVWMCDSNMCIISMYISNECMCMYMCTIVVCMTMCVCVCDDIYVYMHVMYIYVCMDVCL